MFKKRDNIKEIEEGKYLAPKFDKNGLIPVITSDFQTGDILMHGHMNDEALRKTIESREAHYWSRSRNKIWHKGQVSGFVQKVKEIRIDDDQDAIWVKVNTKASCHVGYKSCFYRSVSIKKKKIKMIFKEKKKVFNPKKVYKGLPNPTKI